MKGPFPRVPGVPSSPRSSITRISSTLAIGFVAAALAACSGTGDALGEPAEANDDVVVQQEQPQQDDGANPGDSDVDDDGVAGAADDADGGNAIILPARTIDATVYVGGLEYTIGEVRVLDLDDEAGRLPQRTHGLQVDIDVEAFNPTDSQSMVNLMATLSWVDPESGLLHQGFGSPPQGAGVPGGGRANLALEYQVDGMEVDTFSLESAALRFGNEGQHAAVVPLGDEGELKSKFPHFQEQMVGVTVELEDVSWTIDEAFIGYNHGNSRLGDDQVLLEIAYTFANDSEHQQCHYRGDGQNFELLHTATGIGTTDLGTERCVRSGAQEQWRTGFLLPSDGFTGTWTLTVNQDYQDGPASMQDLNAQVEVEVIDNPLSIGDCQENGGSGTGLTERKGCEPDHRDDRSCDGRDH